MIIAKDDSWAICTPPKTGTVSLQSALVGKHAKKSKFRHSSEWDGTGVRYLIVRHPLERWASMYWYTLSKIKRGIFLKHFAHDINKYAKEWLRRVEQMPHPYFTDDQTEFFKKFAKGSGIDGVHIVKMEDEFEWLLAMLYEVHDLTVDSLPHNNTTPNKLDWKKTSTMLQPKLRARIIKWAQRDMKTFGYE